jgi:hypothetical protein
MLESFLDEVRESGQIRILSFPECSTMAHIVMGPIITKDHKIGVQIQDKTSGKYLMIELGATPEETQTFIKNLTTAFEIATGCHTTLHKLLKDKADAKSSRS